MQSTPLNVNVQLIGVVYLDMDRYTVFLFMYQAKNFSARGVGYKLKYVKCIVSSV